MRKWRQERELKLLELGLKADDDMDLAAHSVRAASETCGAQTPSRRCLLAVADLKAGATLPKRIVRDPVTGKAIGMETIGMETPKAMAAQVAANGKANGGPPLQ